MSFFFVLLILLSLKARVVSLSLSLARSTDTPSFLHLARLAIIGKPVKEGMFLESLFIVI